MNSPSQPSHLKVESPTASRARPRITVIGYGEGAGREHARRLRDRGHDVRVAMLPGGMSWVRAVSDGFRPTRARPATVDADVIVLLVPPDEVELLYWEDVAPVASPGAMVIFEEALDLDDDRFPTNIDVATIDMTADGCTVSVRTDATGHAHDRALAYLQALGGNVPRPPSSRLRVADEADPFPHPSRRAL
jgi:ketol-acid reductoisomerase